MISLGSLKEKECLMAVYRDINQAVPISIQSGYILLAHQQYFSAPGALG